MPRSNTVVGELLSKRVHNSRISNAGVENVLISVLLYNDVCIVDSPTPEVGGFALIFRIAFGT